MNRANDRESYRLWFEFLKRAVSDPSVKVNLAIYKAWGRFAEQGFETWWRKTGSSVTGLEKQTFLEVVDQIDKDSNDLYIRIPASVTTTQATSQLRAILSDRQRKAEALKSPLRIRAGAEIRHAAFRSYLVTYDAHRLLSSRTQSLVSGKALLQEVRDLYADRLVRSIGGVSRGSQIDALPSPLYGRPGLSQGVDRDTDAQAIATVLRYLKKANEVVRNVAQGKFPD